MRSTLDVLRKELSDLRVLVDSIRPVNSALAVHRDTVVQQYLLIRRRFDYAAFVVALYASFEKFIEDLVKGYLRLEARRIDYASLPDKLRNKHLDGTAKRETVVASSPLERTICRNDRYGYCEKSLRLPVWFLDLCIERRRAR